VEDRLKSNAKYWHDQAKKWAHEVDSFINKKNDLKQAVAQAVSPNDPPIVKLRKLYARAQQIRNTGFDPIGAPPAKSEKFKDNHNVKDVLKNGYGSPADINALFIGLARTAGFDSSKLYFADRANSVFHPNLENAHELNNEIVLVRLNGKNLFLDPGTPDAPFGILPWHESGMEGLAVSKDGATFINIPSTKAEESITERRADLTLAANGALTGTLEIDFNGVRGIAIRSSERGEGQSDRRKDLSKIIHPWLPSGGSFKIGSVTGWKHSSAPLKVEGKLTIPGYGSSLGKRLLVPITPFTSNLAGAFHSATRVNAVYFDYPFAHRDEITFHLPAGYGVESLPKLPSVKGPAFVYTVTAAKQGNVLNVTRDLEVLGFYFDARYYSSIRSFFSMVKTTDDNQAVLEASVAAAGH